MARAAAVFDLDRTLLVGASGPSSPRPCASRGRARAPTHPRRGPRLPHLRPGGRDPAQHDAHPPGGAGRRGLEPRRGAPRRCGGRRAPRACHPRRSPARSSRRTATRVAAGDGHHHPPRPGRAAGRAAGVRRGRRHPLPGRRRHLRRRDRRRVRVGEGQAARGRGVGRRRTSTSTSQLRLLRQLLRPAAAVGGGPPPRGQPRPAAHGLRGRPALAGAALRRPPGVPKIAGIEPQRLACPSPAPS
jgi:hypothetical protein